MIPAKWASLPLVAICVVEKIAFNTSYFGAVLLWRFGGGAETAPFPMPREGAIHSFTHFAPLPFLSGAASVDRTAALSLIPMGTWMVGTHKVELTANEMKKGMEEMMKRQPAGAAAAD